MEKYKNLVKKHAKALVDTLAILGMVATAAVVSLVLMGHEELVQSQTVQAALWYLVIAQVAFAAFKIYRKQLNDK